MKTSLFRTSLLVILTSFSLSACAQSDRSDNYSWNRDAEGYPPKVHHTEREWRAMLTPEQYRVLREKGTEPAHTGNYHNRKDNGMYHCAGCGIALFASTHKFDSGTGWPSFFQAVDERHVGEVLDRSHGMVRKEVICNACGGHLGHVFDDGPKPTGLRYCVNSASLNFEKEQ